MNKKVKLTPTAAAALRLSKSLAKADARLTAYLRKYDPDQPRDERGRFASTGAAGAVSGGGRILTPANSPSWWPTMSRDLLVIGAVGTAVGLAPVIRSGARGLQASMFRGMGPVAARMAQRFGGHVSGHFQNLARTLGFKIPRGSLRGVPSKYTQRAWDKVPKDVKQMIDRKVDAVARRTRAANPGGKMRVVPPKTTVTPKSPKPKPPRK